MIRLTLALTAALALLGPAGPAAAATIYESATLGPSSPNAFDVSGQQYAAVRFELQAPATSTEIGGHFTRWNANGSGNNKIFAALVSLTGPADFPDSPGLTTSDVLGIALLDVTFPSSEISAPLAASLGPGWYALVFGSGAHGASGNAGIPESDALVGSPDYFRYAGFTPTGWYETFPPRNARFFLHGVVLPEPSALVLLCGAGLSLALARARLRR